MKTIHFLLFKSPENDGMFQSVKDVTQELPSIIVLQFSIVLSWKVINNSK